MLILLKPVADIQKAFRTAHAGTEVLRTLVPNSGAYQNEADVFTTDPVNDFWGSSNHARLLAIKRAIDPNNVLTCWDCVGWEPTDPRYGCYPTI